MWGCLGWAPAPLSQLYEKLVSALPCRRCFLYRPGERQAAQASIKAVWAKPVWGGAVARAKWSCGGAG